MPKQKHPKGSISGGEQRDLGSTKAKLPEVNANFDQGKRKHTSDKGGIPNLEISELANFKPITDPESTNRQSWEPAGVISHIPRIIDQTKQKNNQDKGGELNLELDNFFSQNNLK